MSHHEKKEERAETLPHRIEVALFPRVPESSKIHFVGATRFESTSAPFLLFPWLVCVRGPRSQLWMTWGSTMRVIRTVSCLRLLLVLPRRRKLGMYDSTLSISGSEGCAVGKILRKLSAEMFLKR